MQDNKKICSVDGCEKTTVGRGLCDKHYRRMRAYGDPLITSRNPPGMFDKCIIEGCPDRPISKGLCNKHYTRAYKYGSPNIASFVPAAKGEPEKWLREVALKTCSDDCLRYPFALAKGYGQVWISGIKYSAHRFICAEINGPPPTKNHAAAHSCGHSWCVNPRHISWKTYAENEADKFIHGTRGLGEKAPGSKLKEQEVRKILSMEGTHTQIAERFGVAPTTIGAIKSGKIWGHLS